MWIGGVMTFFFFFFLHFLSGATGSSDRGLRKKKQQKKTSVSEKNEGGGRGWTMGHGGQVYCPMSFLTNESNWSSSLIPTNWSMTSPPRMAITVGTADTYKRTPIVTGWTENTEDIPAFSYLRQKKCLTPYSMARSVCSSISTLAMVTRPFCLAMAFSSLGPRILQGPHQLQEESKTWC